MEYALGFLLVPKRSENQTIWRLWHVIDIVKSKIANKIHLLTNLQAVKELVMHDTG